MLQFKGLTALPALDAFLQPPSRLFFALPIGFHFIIKLNSISSLLPCRGKERSFISHIFSSCHDTSIPIIRVVLLPIAPEPPTLNLKVLFKSNKTHHPLSHGPQLFGKCSQTHGVVFGILLCRARSWIH